jgi:IclR family acetate operon transcriptional repressor
VTDLAAVHRELAEIRQRGVAVDREEFVSGVMCVAAPVRDHDGVVVAAVTISGPSQRVGPSIETLTGHVKACAAEVSEAMGYAS